MAKARKKIVKPAAAKKRPPTEAEAATAIARAWLAKAGFHEDPTGESPERVEITDTSFDDDGNYFVVVKMYIPNLDVELVTYGEHPDGIAAETTP